jgi:hypothetical protein
MLRWLPSEEGLDTIGLEATCARDAARMARLGPVRPGPLARLADTVRARFEDRHALTELPCRMPDGRIGRTAIREVEGDWIAVCVLPRGKPGGSLSDTLRAEATWATEGW